MSTLAKQESRKGNSLLKRLISTPACFRRRQYLDDFFNTMLDVKWRYVHLLFFFAFVGSWFFFALLWWLILYYHGDFEADHLPDEQVGGGCLGLAG